MKMVAEDRSSQYPQHENYAFSWTYNGNLSSASFQNWVLPPLSRMTQVAFICAAAGARARAGHDGKTFAKPKRAHSKRRLSARLRKARECDCAASSADPPDSPKQCD